MRFLDVQHLRKTFGDTVAVDDISFSLDSGEVLGLLGPNGAGKTTTMLMISGLLEPDAGTILLNGQDVGTGGVDRRRMLGVVPQDLAIYPDLTASENLHFFGKLYGVQGAELRQRADDILDQTQLTQHADAPARTFSGGMKRRLNFGVALMHAPQLLILDEPTVGVDPQSRSHLLNSIRAVADRGTAVIYASHYMEEVEAICPRVVIVDQGRVVAADLVERLLDRVAAGTRLRVTDPSGAAAELVELGVRVEQANGEWQLTVHPGDQPLRRIMADVCRSLDGHGIEIQRIDSEEASLERLFLDLTGRSLRD